MFGVCWGCCWGAVEVLLWYSSWEQSCWGTAGGAAGVLLRSCWEQCFWDAAGVAVRVLLGSSDEMLPGVLLLCGRAAAWVVVGSGVAGRSDPGCADGSIAVGMVLGVWGLLGGVLLGCCWGAAGVLLGFAGNKCCRLTLLLSIQVAALKAELDMVKEELNLAQVEKSAKELRHREEMEAVRVTMNEAKAKAIESLQKAHLAELQGMKDDHEREMSAERAAFQKALHDAKDRWEVEKAAAVTAAKQDAQLAAAQVRS